MARAIHFNTPEAVAKYLRDALALVESLDTPDDLRVTCFEKAVDLLQGKQVFFDQADATGNVLPAMAIPGNRPH